MVVGEVLVIGVCYCGGVVIGDWVGVLVVEW